MRPQMTVILSAPWTSLPACEALLEVVRPPDCQILGEVPLALASSWEWHPGDRHGQILWLMLLPLQTGSAGD